VALPKRKKSRARRDYRRAHWKLTAVTYVTCPSCTEPMLPHHACPSCGQYKGREVVKVEEE